MWRRGGRGYGLTRSDLGGGEGAVFDRPPTACGLSKREREVAALLCRGRTNREIADALFVAVQTVKDHNYTIFQKAQRAQPHRTGAPVL